jgi:benzoate-CoA ligase
MSSSDNIPFNASDYLSLAFPLAAGATAILEPRRPPTPSLVASIIRDERPTLFFSVPTFYAGLLAAELAPDTFASVRHAASAGERLPAEVGARFRERFGVELLDGVGSTELTHIYISNRPGAARPGSSGTPVSGYRVRLEDADGNAVPAGTPGRLLVSGATMASGYWCRAAATRRSFRGEWFDSGDMCVCSPDGFYTYLGRADDMFKVAGEWVAPAEVEAVLVEHPAVLEAVVIGEARPDGLIEPVAYVVAAPGQAIDRDALLEHCRGRLAGFKRPRRIVVLERLRKSGMGKIERSKVSDEASLAVAA